MSSWFPTTILGYKLLDDPVAYGTGDLILFSGESALSKAIKFCSRSKFSHCGIVLREPTYIDSNLVGTYFIESTLNLTPDAEDGKPKFGVTIHLLADVLASHAKDGDKSYLRKVQGLSGAHSLDERIRSAYDVTKNIPYNVDPVAWIRAKEASNATSIDDFIAHHRYPQNELQDTRALWCSEFVGYFYSKIGVLDRDTPWSLLAPAHFSAKEEDLDFANGCSLGPERII